MNKFYFFSLLILLSNSAISQNLVPNHSFESYTICPVSTNQGGGLNLVSWYVPTLATSDNLNVCNNVLNGIVGVPDNVFGYQDSSEGDKGYVGLYAIQEGIGDYKEYIACKLNSSLIKGNYYRVAMNVSLAEKVSTVGCNGLGAFLFTDTINSYYKKSWQNTLPYTAQVNFSSFGNITDTTNWVIVADTIQADSAYNYIIIGSVLPAANISMTPIKANPTSNRAYYFINNVVVEQVTVTVIEDLDQSSISFNPNPFTNFLKIDPAGEEKDITIWTVSGQMVHNFKTNTAQTINTERWSPGMYIVTIENESGVYRTKILKQ